MEQLSHLAGIEYAGIAGASAECKHVIVRFIQNQDVISRARILTSDNSHCFLLTVNGDLVAVKSGFASGYSGEGPRAFSYVLALLEFHNIEIEEYEVKPDVIERLDMTSLTIEDIEEIESSRPIRPKRLYEYINISREERRMLWQSFPSILPLSIIDPRIADLALDFWKDPDQKLTLGYRRLEDIVREKINSKEYGTGLFTEAFLSQNPKLKWENIENSEQKGRGQLFVGAYMAYRNPRAHREIKDYSHQQLVEFLLLNQLYLLEQESYLVIEKG